MSLLHQGLWGSDGLVLGGAASPKPATPDRRLVSGVASCFGPANINATLNIYEGARGCVAGRRRDQDMVRILRLAYSRAAHRRCTPRAEVWLGAPYVLVNMCVLYCVGSDLV